jgi:methionyl-tRNA formyltransferase
MPKGKLRLVFMGTPDFALPTFAALCQAPDMDVVAVYTQPPRQAGRGRKLQPTAVHQAALARDIPIHTPASLKAAEVQAEFAAHEADAAVVVAYGLILPAAILEAPRLGCFNLHGSLLPRWRGAAPIQRAVMAGDSVTGVCVMAMDQGLDTGPELLRAEQPIGPRDTAGSLHDDLAQLGAPLMVQALRGMAAGELQPRTQPNAGITHAGKIDKAEARIDWTASANDLDCLIRGLSPFPGAWCQWRGERIKILLATKVGVAASAAAAAGGPPGTIQNDGLSVTCGTGALRLLRLQRPGKGVMAAADCLRGMALSPGDRFE